MEKDHAQPNPLFSSCPGDQQSLHFQLLTLNQRQSSMVTGTADYQNKQDQCISSKTKFIQKDRKFGNNSHTKQKTRPNYKKKIDCLERRIKELQKQLCILQRKYQCCPNCRYNIIQGEFQNQMRMQQEQYLSNIAGQMQQKRNSRDSLQFEKIDLCTPMNFTSQMQQRTWVYLGTLMIIMGSKIMDVDGTLNVFKVLKQSVDNIRRQVQKCEQKINLDFFHIKQDIQQAPQSIMRQFDFDLLNEKSQQGKLQLDGLRVQSVDQFQLIYDRKTTFSVRYQGLITVMEYIKEHCWLN